jgi:hypothetical protein
MKKLLLVSICVSLITGCNENKSPKEVVTEFLKSLDNFELEKANSFLQQNEENRVALNNIKKFEERLTDEQKRTMLAKAKNRVYVVTEKEVSDSSALVIASNDQGSHTVVISFELIKDKGKWIIKSFKDSY